MPRSSGERYVCESCGSALVYEVACNCTDGAGHSEVCCGKQMQREDTAAERKDTQATAQ